MTGYYIETYYPENKVRFISIVENYDSLKKQASNDSSTFIIACKDLNVQLEDINIEIEKRKNSTDKLPNYINKIKRLLNLNNPNKDLLFALIERIEADKNQNIIIKFRYDILDTHTFKYEDNRVHNPYGRKGKN